ncbi:MAG: endonuclease/exonuclease/phosphatase family protein [Candidatus Heimdallarchaeota archaeon]|nr:MAG: endonuclease/exonuclease/phosphatase family protein [Candidatus Heimdallarchaeota archaeon]
MNKSQFRLLMVLSIFLLFVNPFSLSNGKYSNPNKIDAESNPPTVMIINPAQTTVGDTVTIHFDATDESRIVDFEVQIDSVAVNRDNIIRKDNYFIYYWDTDAETAGSHNLKTRVKDEFDNWGEADMTVTVDKTYESGVIKILNWNIDGNRQDDKRWIPVAKAENADIMFLDEIGPWTDTPSMFTNSLNELNDFFSDEEPYAAEYESSGRIVEGHSIWSRFPIVDIENFEHGVFDNGTDYELYRDALHAIIEIGETYVHFVGVHLKCCDNFDIVRENDMEALINFIDSLGPVPVIFLGDFNTFSPYDVGDVAPNPGTNLGANLGIGPITFLLNQSHPLAPKNHTWIDVFRELDPHNPGFTWYDDQYKSRIDHIFVNEFFFDKLINTTVFDTPAEQGVFLSSDHRSLDVFINMDASTTDLRPPTRVHKVTGTLVDATGVDLTWAPNNESDFSHYNVYRNESLMSQELTNQYEDENLISYTYYYYHVSATDTTNNEGFKSFPIIVNTAYGICKKPNAPIVQGSGAKGKITLTWEVNDTGGLPILAYAIKRRYYDPAIKMEADFPRGRVLGNETTFIDPMVVSGRTYRYLVIAINELGESEVSNIVEVTVEEAPPTTTEKTIDQEATPFSISSLFLGLVFIVLVAGNFRRRHHKN